MPTLEPGRLDLGFLQDVHGGAGPIVLAPEAGAAIEASAATVSRAAAGEAPVYGVNTGFGKLASTRISADDLAQLQLNLIRSHSAGVGEPLPDAVVRLVLVLKAASLASRLLGRPRRGHRGATRRPQRRPRPLRSGPGLCRCVR